MAKKEKITVPVEARSATGKNACRQLRAAGMIPGNVYGMALPPFAVSVDPRKVEEVLSLSSGRNTIFQLSLEGGKESRDVMLREMQRDPVSEHLLHVDFMRVDPDRRMNVFVPVRLLGTAEGVKNEGGILDFVQRQVEVSCLPADIPEHLSVDIAGLHLNQNVAVKELEAMEGVEILDDPEAILAVVVPSRAPEVEVAAAEEEAAEVAAEEGEEPEVIGKGKAAEAEKPEGEER